MRILVTGGTGFLGAAFAVGARAAGHEVLTLDRDPQADVVCDIGDTPSVRAAVLDARPEVLVHLAGWLTTDAAADVVGATQVNALGTAALFSAAEEAGARRIVYASSVAAIGPCAPGSGDAVVLRPATPYGVTKAFGEQLAAVMAAGPSAPSYVALRFGWVYGPGRARGWRDVQSLIERVAAGERRIAFPDYPEPIDWTWLGDAVDALLRSLTRPMAPFAALNVVGDKRRVRDAMAHLRHRFPDLQTTAEQAATPPSAWGLVNDGIAAALGRAPATTLEQGIDLFLDALAPHQTGSSSRSPQGASA